MTFPDLTPALRAAMPDLRGKIAANVRMGDLTWFRTGGPAQVLFAPADEEDLAYFLSRLDPALPVLPVGVGSNLLVRDGGIEGIVIRLGRPFHEIRIEAVQITAGAGVLDVKLALAAAEAGIAGLAFYRGIPGSIGGALRMNGGAYGAETKDVLISCRGVDRGGKLRTFTNADMGFAYRCCGIASDVIFTSALFAGRPGDPAAIKAEMAEITEVRQATQPISARTGGSTFKNPQGHKAWQLIDRAGCRGLVIGDAQVSDLHCNFLINRGAASAADIENLGEEVRRRVFATSGIRLEWEIERVGQRPQA
ncbi:MAG TPA: UDP-N-acetylmuramate dehydrogenase [Methylovirgula sp.]|nr:UDP-N-acetylmuramate dehydrogenase [Methylovirgula sp.]